MPLTRREVVRSIAVTGVAMVVPGLGLAQARPLTKPIPSSGEALPMVGLGSWITFNVGNDPVAASPALKSWEHSSMPAAE